MIFSVGLRWSHRHRAAQPEARWWHAHTCSQTDVHACLLAGSSRRRTWTHGCTSVYVGTPTHSSRARKGSGAGGGHGLGCSPARGSCPLPTRVWWRLRSCDDHLSAVPTGLCAAWPASPPLRAAPSTTCSTRPVQPPCPTAPTRGVQAPRWPTGPRWTPRPPY